MRTIADAMELRHAGRYLDALRALDHAASCDLDQLSTRIMKADLLEMVGHPSQAISIAERALKSTRLSPSDRARCLFIISKVLFEDGKTDDALSQLQRAAALSQKASDLELLCWILNKMMIVVAERSGPGAAAPILSEIRKTTTRLGDPQMAALAHMYLGEMEGKRGRAESAQRHASLGQSLLGESPNCWIEAFAENIHLASCVLRSHLDRAVSHAERALRLADASGGASVKRSVFANFGNLLYMQGNFDKAVQFFELALDALPSRGEKNNGILETLARIRLSQERLDDCQAYLDQIEQSLRTEKDRSFYANRYAALTRVRLHTRRGLLEKARAEIEGVFELADKTGDASIARYATLTKAEVLLANGESIDLDSVSASMATVPETEPDLYAGYERLLGTSLAAQGEVTAASLHFERAARLSRILNDEPSLIELGRARDRAGDMASSANTPRSDDFKEGTRHALDNIATAVLFASRPEIVAGELGDLLLTTGCASSATVFHQVRDGVPRLVPGSGSPAADAEGSTKSFIVDERPDARTELRVCVSDGLHSECAINIVGALIGKLRALEGAREEAVKRTRLWQYDEPFATPDGNHIITGHMRDLMTSAQKVARTKVNVLITGESGTGKEILARAIHEFSDRAQKPFVPFNCSAVPRDLLESQLFGHRRGAFTGAERDQLGLIRSAVDGTLFLDEIGDMSADLQPKLLRFLESGEIAPLGEPSPITVNVRVVAATNANLEDLVRDGKFREDLFYRLNVVRLTVNPLRERRDEIPGMVNHFVAAAAREHKKGHLEVSEDTMERLLLYRWPGNVRQLQNEVRRMVALAEPNSTIEPESISAAILGAMPNLRPAGINGREIAIPLHEKLLPTLSRIEYEMIKAALREHHGRVEPAAKSLGISRKGLYLKRQRLGL
jgi:DNA-binding NtrC family response regulator/tetratricopeptide (TPR) repeat protein